MKIVHEKRNQSGFTLLEILVALSILAIGLLAVASMQGVAINSNAIANRISVGNMLSQEVAEDIHSWNRTDSRLLSTVVNPYMLDHVTPSNTIRIQGAGSYTANYLITQNTPTTGTTQIQVTVRYVNPNGVERTVGTYTTYKMVL